VSRPVKRDQPLPRRQKRNPARPEPGIMRSSYGRTRLADQAFGASKLGTVASVEFQHSLLFTGAKRRLQIQNRRQPSGDRFSGAGISE